MLGNMKTQDAIKYYGSQSALARAVGVTRAAVNAWGDEMPIGRQFQIEVLTSGALKADRQDRKTTEQAA